MAITRTARGTSQSKAVTTLDVPATGNFTPSADETIIAIFAVDDVTIDSITWTGDSSNFTQDVSILNAGNVRVIIARMKKSSWSAGVVRISVGSSAAIAGAASSYTNLTDALDAQINNTGTGTAFAQTGSSITGTPGTGLQYLFIAGIAAEGPNTDTIDTWNSTDNPDNAGQKIGTTGAGAASNVTVLEGYEINSTEVTNTLSVSTYSSSRDWAAALAGYKELTSATTTDQTITALARIAGTQDQTITAKARLTATQDQTVTALARMTAVVDQTVTALARITATQDRTVTALARLTGTQDQTINAVANIILPATDQTITAKGRITATVDQTVTAQARIAGTQDREVTAVARIVATTDQTIAAVARLTGTQDRTVDALARLSGTQDREVTALARIVSTVDRTINSVARINAVVDATIDVQARLAGTQDRTITAVANIFAPGVTPPWGAAKEIGDEKLIAVRRSKGPIGREEEGV